MPSSAPRRTPPRTSRLFHQTLAATGSLAAAARAAAISLPEARRLRSRPAPQDLDLPARPGSQPGDRDADRIASAVAALEAEALRRALEGVSEPVFHQGRECGSRVKHSDTLLMFLLKTLRPERYGPAAARREEGEDGEEAEGPDGGRGPLVLDLDLSAGEGAEAP